MTYRAGCPLPLGRECRPGATGGLPARDSTAAIAVVISNKEGDVLDGQNEGADAVVGKKLADKWWENSDQVMSAKDKAGTPLIARRQGLLDRSKTIFALVNADDYEMVQQ